MKALAWDRPLAAVLVLLPLVLWFVVRRRAEARVVASGATALWQRLVGDVPRADRRGGARAPRWLVLALAGLAATAVALAGPRCAESRAHAELHVHVARDAAWLVDAEREDGRLARALDALHALVRALEPQPAALVWHAAGRASATTAVGAAPPRDWFVADVADGAPLVAPDAADAVWLVARAPSDAPAAAGVVAPGGPAVDGAVAWSADARWEARDGALVLAAAAGERPRVLVPSSAPWDGVLGAAVRAWAEARGLATAGDGPVVLECASAAPLDVPVRAGRDGWSVSLEPVAAAGAPPRGAPWLVAEGAVLVATSTGRIEAASARWQSLEDDGALFALSVAALCDRVARAPEGVHAASARAALGPALVQAPRWRGGEPTSAAPWRAALPTAAAATLAALAFALAAVLRRATPRGVATR